MSHHSVSIIISQYNSSQHFNLIYQSWYQKFTQFKLAKPSEGNPQSQPYLGPLYGDRDFLPAIASFVNKTARLNLIPFLKRELKSFKENLQVRRKNTPHKEE